MSLFGNSPMGPQKPGVRNLQVTPFDFDNGSSNVASGSLSASAMDTYHASSLVTLYRNSQMRLAKGSKRNSSISTHASIDGREANRSNRFALQSRSGG
jgi:hypothetical protein